MQTVMATKAPERKGETSATRRIPKAVLIFGAALLSLLLGGMAWAGEYPAPARISSVGMAGMIRGTQDADWTYASLNTPVMAGDALWVDKEGTMEIEFPGGTLVRMADGSKLSVASLPPEVILKAELGSFYVQRMHRSSGDVTLSTPAAKIRVDPDTNARLDILSSGASTVSVRWGRAVIQGGGAADVVVSQGERSYVDPGYAPAPPEDFDRSAEDAFDVWNRERSHLLAIGNDAVPAEADIPPGVVGAADLAGNGEWVNVDGEDYWHPTAEGFVPYRNGDWSYVPDCGYVWVGAEPYSYLTCHYGRWRYDDGCGWL